MMLIGLSMGGYGVYVWSTYALFCLSLVTLGLYARRSVRQMSRKLRQQLNT